MRQGDAEGDGGIRGGTARRWQHTAPHPNSIPRRRSSRGLLRVLRVVLPALAVGLVVLAVFWPQIFPPHHPGGLDLAKVERDPGSAEETMVDATYSGVDRQGRPFTLSARRVQAAVQGAMQRSDVLMLTAPRAQITMRDGGILALTAETGAYDRERQSLELTGDVTLTRGSDVRVRTSRASIDLDAGAASGQAPVQGEAPFGTIEGEGFEVQDLGERVVVAGPATMHFRPENALPGQVRPRTDTGLP